MIKLYDYFRSSASYRVRLVLAYKKILYAKEQIHLVNNGGEQHSLHYKAINPQGLVPALVLDNPDLTTLTQSLAIIEYLEELYPNPAILPQDHYLRAEARKLAYIVSCDMHPLNNLRVLKYLTDEFQINDQQKEAWYHHWLKQGFDGYETAIKPYSKLGSYSLGKQFTLADVCLIPQVYNAIRFKFPMDPYPAIMNVYNNCLKLPCVAEAKPE